MTDYEMLDEVCGSIQGYGGEWCVGDAEHKRIDDQCDWVRALLAERNALLVTVAAQKKRIDDLTDPNVRYPDLKDWLQAYYGPNVAHLIRVKRQVDRNDVFKFHQSIPV